MGALDLGGDDLCPGLDRGWREQEFGDLGSRGDDEEGGEVLAGEAVPSHALSQGFFALCSNTLGKLGLYVLIRAHQPGRGTSLTKLLKNMYGCKPV